MSSSNCSTVEGSSSGGANPPLANGALAAISSHSYDATESTSRVDQGHGHGKKRKRSKRSRSPGDGAEKPRRERANFNAAQLHALERLFHDQKYPDADLRAKIAQRLDLNEERVQIWFQNRRAKYKRLQREGAGCAVPDEPSALAAYDYVQPSSLDYIPPQLDADMLGPGPCTVQSFTQSGAALSSALRPVPNGSGPDVNPVPDEGASAVRSAQSATGNPHRPIQPLVNGPTPHQHNQQQQAVNDIHQQGSSAVDWLKWNCEAPINSPQSTNGMLHNGMNKQSVGKLTGPETVEFPSAIDQTRMNVAPAPGPVFGSSDQVPCPPGAMCPTLETSWNGNSLESIDTVPLAPLAKIADSSSSGLCPAGNKPLAAAQLNGVTSPATQSACSRSKLHNGEAPCHKDSKCITCQQKPPPNQVCTAVPPGERNELDEALYRCAVGSILSIRPHDSRPADNVTGGAASNPTASLSQEPNSTPTTVKEGQHRSPFRNSTGGKSSRTPRENSLSAQRRMAMLRKQRQVEEEFLSSSSDSSSDSEDEARIKRRRKVARRLENNGAPPNQVCTAVPLLDRTLPLPCLTKDLDLDGYLNDVRTPAGRRLLNPQDEFLSCLPSPISLDRLSSPEPQSSHSEHPECSSSSSSDFSDSDDATLTHLPATSYRLSSPPSTRVDLHKGNRFVGPKEPADVQRSSAILQTHAHGASGLTAPVTANGARCDAFQYCGTSKPYMSRPDSDCKSPLASCTYAQVAPPHTSEAAHKPTSGEGLLLPPVPSPFAMQLESAVTGMPSSVKWAISTGVKGGSSPASDENRRNQTCEVLAESRIVGEMCRSPASPWSAESSSVKSPYFNPVSPPSLDPVPWIVPVKSNPSVHGRHANAGASWGGYAAQSVSVGLPRADTSRYHQSPAAHHPQHFHENNNPMQPYNFHIPPVNGGQTSYDHSLRMHQNFSTAHGSNGFHHNYSPTMNFERQPQPPKGPPVLPHDMHGAFGAYGSTRGNNIPFDHLFGGAGINDVAIYQ